MSAPLPAQASLRTSQVPDAASSSTSCNTMRFFSTSSSTVATGFLFALVLPSSSAIPVTSFLDDGQDVTSAYPLYHDKQAFLQSVGDISRTQAQGASTSTAGRHILAALCCSRALHDRQQQDDVKTLTARNLFVLLLLLSR